MLALSRVDLVARIRPRRPLLRGPRTTLATCIHCRRSFRGRLGGSLALTLRRNIQISRWSPRSRALQLVQRHGETHLLLFEQLKPFTHLENRELSPCARNLLIQRWLRLGSTHGVHPRVVTTLYSLHGRLTRLSLRRSPAVVEDMAGVGVEIGALGQAHNFGRNAERAHYRLVISPTHTKNIEKPCIQELSEQDVRAFKGAYSRPREQRVRVSRNGEAKRADRRERKGRTMQLGEEKCTYIEPGKRLEEGEREKRRETESDI